jgi:hypothetical protein
MRKKISSEGRGHGFESCRVRQLFQRVRPIFSTAKSALSGECPENLFAGSSGDCSAVDIKIGMGVRRSANRVLYRAKSRPEKQP